LYLTDTSAFIEDEILLNDDFLRIESVGEDWMALRDNKRQVYLLNMTYENEHFFERIKQRELFHFIPEPLDSTWIGAHIYGYCNGFFDRDYYFNYDHVIEAVGPDWIVARNVDEWETGGRLYLAYFDNRFKDQMDDFLTNWSSEEEKEEWNLENLRF
jgi:hypothetical protein